MNTKQPSPFKCVRCSRYYELESALKRHWYYCRTRNPVRRTHRKRSCIPCIQAKAKCSSTLPSCLTCTTKKLRCQYDSDTLRELEARGQVSSRTDDLTWPLDYSGDLDVNLQDMNLDQFLMDEHMVGQLEPFNLDSKSKSTAPSPVTSFWENLSGQAPWTSPTADLVVSNSIPDEELPLQFRRDSLDLDIPRSIVSVGLVLRRQNNLVTQASAKMLRSIMMSFPRMMQRRETLPPFIHPTMLASGDESSLPRSHDDLAQCMSLAKTWSFQKPQTMSFVWRTVRTQIEKWWSDNHTYSNSQLLACQQALLVYTLMRMAEGTDIPNPVDEPLLLALGIVSKTLVDRVGNAEFIYGVLHPVQSWDEWILHESRRRIATLARLINLLVDLDSVVACYLLAGYVLVPLPSGRSIWEASNEKIWKKELDLSMTHKKVYGLGVDGKLKILPCPENGETNAREVKWEELLAYENGFGTMVMIAGSMIEANTPP